jgi:hypothetical protein
MLTYDHSVPSPNDIINEQELDTIVNKFGSFLSIIVNKPISCVTVFTMLRKDTQVRDVLLEISDHSWYSVVEYMGHRWPVLNKSKKIK